MTTNQQKFREFCDPIHAAHPFLKRFVYYASHKEIEWYFEKSVMVKSDSALCPDFGPDDLEYTIEPPYEWKVPDETTPVDAKVWARNNNIRWFKCHFKEKDSNCFRTWENGWTSWSTHLYTAWDYCVLADPENPDRKPDDNWRPE